MCDTAAVVVAAYVGVDVAVAGAADVCVAAPARADDDPAGAGVVGG